MSHWTPRSSARPLVAIALGVVVLLSGCSSGDEDVEDVGSTTVFEPKPAISLVVNNWTGSAINAAIAEHLIEGELGYPVVPTRLDDATAMYDGLADGSLDVVLEIWPEDMTERDRLYFERGEVLDIGPLGPVGKVGWFVPRSVLNANPSLATWEGLLDPDVAALFATPATQPDGRFLGTNPDYLQYDEAIITNLRLPLAVVYSGSEEATIAELEATRTAGDPILLYWWTPSAAAAKYDLVGVALPDVTDECLDAAERGGAGVDCDYPEQQLFKATSPTLADKAPPVDAFLRAFTLSTADQAALLAAVELEGMTLAEATAAWIDNNESTWRAWLAAE